jgi:hypothetical protein
MIYPTTIVEDFLTSEEVDIIKEHIFSNIGRHIDKETNYSKFNLDQNENPNYFYYWDYYNDLTVKSILNNKLDEVIGKKYKVVDSHITDCRVPYYVHTDYAHPENEVEKPEYTVLIPMEDSESVTIIFNEYLEEIDCVSKNNHYLSNYKKNYKGEKNLKLDPKFCADNLSHLHIDDLKYLTLETVFKFKKGSLLLFDRKKFHCSDNFIQKGISSKTNIIIWTVSV